MLKVQKESYYRKKKALPLSVLNHNDFRTYCRQHKWKYKNQAGLRKIEYRNCFLTFLNDGYVQITTPAYRLGVVVSVPYCSAPLLAQKVQHYLSSLNQVVYSKENRYELLRSTVV